MSEKIEWNNSRLAVCQDCGEKFRRRYVEGEITPPRVAQLRGTVVHRTIKTTLLTKMREQRLASPEEARDLAATAFDAAWRSAGVLLTREERAQGVRAVEAETKDAVVDLSGLHAERVAPVIQPVGVERHIVVKPRDADITIHGTIDLVDRLPDGTEAIRDAKTSSKSQSQDEADKSQQLTMYGLLRWAEVGTLPSDYRLDYLIRTPARHDLKAQSFKTTRGPADLTALVNRINTAVEAVDKGIFIPAGENSWYCSPKWCEFFDDCKYVVAGRRRPTS